MAAHAAIVTGVSRGLGEALAVALLAKGFGVIGVGRSSSDALGGSNFRFVACDLAHPMRIATAVEPALTELAATNPTRVTLINNAAVAFPVGLVGRLAMAEAEVALATNIAAPLAMCEAFLRAFPDDALARRIINISSGAAQSAIPGSAVYCMSKAAIEMLTRTIAAEHTDPRFRCICVRPGIFETGMQTYMRSHDPADFPSVAMFRGFKENELLKSPAEVAVRIVERLVQANVEHGRTYSQQDL
jgi:NAD(P)-dependent dehydrogenase (short-subunit alcohol dehydrogenase family)